MLIRNIVAIIVCVDNFFGIISQQKIQIVKSAFKGSLIVTSSGRNRAENYSSIPKPNFGDESPTSKPVDKSNPVFCLFLKVATNLFDLTFQPRKTEIEFYNWDLVRNSLTWPVKQLS